MRFASVVRSRPNDALASIFSLFPPHSFSLPVPLSLSISRYTVVLATIVITRKTMADGRGGVYCVGTRQQIPSICVATGGQETRERERWSLHVGVATVLGSPRVG